MTPWLTIVGLNEDGPAGLGDAARQALAAAEVILGGARHLALAPALPHQQHLPWPSPFSAAYDLVLAQRGRPVVVLASGDPLFHGVASGLVQRLTPDEWRILPAPSSVSLAAARLGWPLADTTVVSLTTQPVAALNRHLAPGARLLVLSADGASPAAVAELLRARGFGPSRLVLLEHLGGPHERRLETTAAAWSESRTAELNLLALECRAEPGAAGWSGLAGLPDQAYRHDGQLTKRDVRAVTLARLGPLPGELLWDVGAGCGSIGIEWLRSHASCRAIAIEGDAGRQALIEHNRAALGVPRLQLVKGQAPEALEGLEPPDVIFIGGGLTDGDVPERCWRALKPGGRLVANAVTIQSETRLIRWRAEIGGELTRLAVAQASPLGSFDAFRPALPVTILSALKPR